MIKSMAEAPLLVKAGAVSGMVAGFSTGLVVSSPIGVFFGIALGGIAGVAAGLVLDREEQKENARTRQLDDIIGVTKGSLGARDSIPPESASERDLRTWMTEWLTPRAPEVR